MPSSGNVTVNTGTTLTVEAGAAGDWTSGTSGVGTLGGLFSGTGSAGTSTVSFATDSTLGLEMTGNLTYAGDIPNLGTNVGITKTGAQHSPSQATIATPAEPRVHAGPSRSTTIANVGAGSSASALRRPPLMEQSTSGQAAPRPPSPTQAAVTAPTA